MKVVDIRNIVTDSNVELIEISEDRIYYAEEKNEEGHNSLFILEYDRITHSERIVANYFLNDPTFVQHYFSFKHDIIMVMENTGSSVWVIRLEKQNGKEKNMAQINLVGNFLSCTALDESHLVFYTTENEEHAPIFQQYKNSTGLKRISYLYDLEEESYYYIKDSRVCDLGLGTLLPFDLNGQTQLLILQPYGDEQEKEYCYQNERWLGNGISDNVWRCPLLDFLVAVKASESILPLEPVLSAGTNGLVRYAGMDEEKIYFRVKYFPNNDQRICAVDKQSGKKEVVAELNLKESEAPAKFFIDTAAAKVYHVEEKEDSWQIKGVLNSHIEGEFSKELGEFISCVEDRFVIARYIMSDEKDAFEFNSIYDIQTQEQKSYECCCKVKGTTVVLY